MDYAAWAEAHGLNPWHPERWTPDEQAAFRAWRLARFRAKWRWRRDVGDVALRRAANRSRLLSDVRADLEIALGPPLARSPWKRCPCHRQRFVTSAITPSPEEAIDDDDLAAWRAQDRENRQQLSAKLARALAYLDTFAPKGVTHARETSRGPNPPPGSRRSRWPHRDRP